LSADSLSANNGNVAANDTADVSTSLETLTHTVGESW
jgi:hypothetical protein